MSFYSFLRRESGEGGAHLVSSNRMWEGSKLCQKFRLDTRNHFFTERVVTHWSSLPREVVSVPSLTVFKRYLGNGLKTMV